MRLLCLVRDFSLAEPLMVIEVRAGGSVRGRRRAARPEPVHELSSFLSPFCKAPANPPKNLVAFLRVGRLTFGAMLLAWERCSWRGRAIPSARPAGLPDGRLLTA